MFISYSIIEINNYRHSTEVRQNEVWSMEPGWWWYHGSYHSRINPMFAPTRMTTSNAHWSLIALQLGRRTAISLCTRSQLTNVQHSKQSERSKTNSIEIHSRWNTINNSFVVHLNSCYCFGGWLMLKLLLPMMMFMMMMKMIRTGMF